MSGKCARFWMVLLLTLLVADRVGADVKEGLIAHWRFEQTGGDRIEDATGRHQGTNHGATIDRAARFREKEDDFIDLGTSIQLEHAKQMTVAALLRPESFRMSGSRNMANSRNGILGSSDANFIFALTDRGRPTFVWDAADNQYQQIVVDGRDAVPLDAWSHVAVTRNGPVMNVYINGMLKKTQTGFAPGKFVRFATMQLGRVNNTPKRDFDGQIDEVRLYDRALADKEIWQLADAVKLAGVRPPRPPFGSRGLERVKYNNPGLVVDLGVGLWAWPMPIDADADGDLDLIVCCPDVPYNGTYFFENPGGRAKRPVFKPGVRIDGGSRNIMPSYIDGKVRVLVPGREYRQVSSVGLGASLKLPVLANVHPLGVRANQWRQADQDGDGRLDLIIGVGDWKEYGWDNAFDAQGRWTRGPLHGFVYWLRNTADNDSPQYARPVKLEAAGRPIDVYGMPSPNLADFDGDGDLDILCGEFVDKFTYFQNRGTRTEPKYAAGRLLKVDGRPLRMDLCMIVPVAVDWDGDGDVDLVVGQEDGRVALVEHTGKVVDGTPVFAKPRFFKQVADELKFGALVTPVGFDWDGDGDEDLVCGNTAGYLGFIENLDGGNPPKWAEPEYLEIDGRPIRIEAGPNGSIQGPCEAKWGYTTLSVADWDHDELPDLMVNSIWGKVVWYRNIGTRKQPKLTNAEPVQVEWPGQPPKPAWNWWEPEAKQLATQWRTTPVMIDWDRDGLNDLVMLDSEGYLAWFQRKRVDGQLRLLPPRRVFLDAQGQPLRLNAGAAGRSGRRKLCFADWDRDGRIDLLINSRNVEFWRNESDRDGLTVLKNLGQIDSRRLAGHTTSPTVVDWDSNGLPDMLLGGEDGYFYYMKNPSAKPVEKQASASRTLP